MRCSASEVSEGRPWPQCGTGWRARARGPSRRRSSRSWWAPAWPPVTGGSRPGARCWRWSSRSRCRSASTTPTTTATGSAAPTSAGSARSGWSRRVSPGPARSWPPRSAASRVACLAGLVLAAVTSWWLLLLGAAAVAAAWFYTGGSHPYGYRALGEVSVFLFFGLAAVVGTAYVQMGRMPWLAVAAAAPGRPAGLRAPGDQQPARHPDRHGDRQAHAGGGARRSPDPRCCTRPAS